MHLLLGRILSPGYISKVHAGSAFRTRWKGRMRMASLVLGSHPAQNGLLTGLGGSLWLRALWMLPISVWELEWDRPSK